MSVVNAEDLVRLVTPGPAWCLNLDVISPAQRRAPGFDSFLQGKTHLRVAYTDAEAGGHAHRVAKPREKVIIKDDGGDLSNDAGVVGVGEIVANYHNPENPFLKISLETHVSPPVPPEEFRSVPDGMPLYATLAQPTLFKIIEEE